MAREWRDVDLIVKRELPEHRPIEQADINRMNAALRKLDKEADRG